MLMQPTRAQGEGTGNGGEKEKSELNSSWSFKKDFGSMVLPAFEQLKT
jgi:hypothetical protein